MGAEHFITSWPPGMEEAGIPVLAKPLSKARLASRAYVMLCTAAAAALQRASSRRRWTLQEKMQESAASSLSAKRLHGGSAAAAARTERAHRYLLKRAMDQCCSKYEAATLDHSANLK